MLNYFYWDMSPYHQEFTNENKVPFETKPEPDMGLPTPEDTRVKSTPFALIKEQSRLKRLHSDDPKFVYMIEVIGQVARTLHITVGEGDDVKTETSPFALEDSGYVLSQHNHVLFLPQPEFIQKLFLAATKPRAVVAACKAYMHYCYHDEALAQKLFDTVKNGLCDYDYDKIRPFLVLF